MDTLEPLLPIHQGYPKDHVYHKHHRRFHRQLRAITKSKGAFHSEDALVKLLYLAQENITAKWNRPLHKWNQTLAQLSIIFGDRLKLNL